MYQFLPLAEAADSSGGMSSWITIILLYAVVIGGLYLIVIRPQSKKKKKEAALRKNAQIGDEVTTIGGISGRIIAIKEDTDSIILETGTDRNKINVKRWAISTVDSQVAPSANETNTAKISKKAEKDEAKKDEKTEEK